MGNPSATEGDASAESLSFLSSNSAMTSSLYGASSPAARLNDKGASRHSSQPPDTTVVTRRQLTDPYATLGQLSYAPATQTTIVTTTTTTTTTFPPLVMKPPRSLKELDPKQYPLATAPTPQSLRSFCFDFGGRPACFRESDNAEQTIQECNQKYNSLQASNGVLRSVQEDGPHYQTPSRFLRHKSATFEDPQGSSTSNASRPKRSLSPSGAIPSIAEAVEIVSLQRKSKKHRTSSSSKEREKGKFGSRLRSAQDEEHTNGTIPATPDTDAGSTGQFKIPKTRPRSRRSQLRSSALSQSKAIYSPEEPLDDIGEASEHAELQDSQRKGPPSSSSMASNSRDGSSASTFANGLRLLGAPSVIDGPGASATPPIAESDLEPVMLLEAENMNFSRPPRPAPLDTVSTQNASLPSPSLSPTTAAATLAHHGSASTTTLDDDDSNEVSSLDISQDNVEEDYGRVTKLDRLRPGQSSRLQESNMNLRNSSPTVMEIPTMLDSFDALPDELKTYVMYQLLRRCAKQTLHFVADVVNPALKCDFLGLLPLELSLNIVKYLDFKSMCRAAQVSKKWRQVINSDEKTWKELLDKDGYTLPDGELQRAIREGWGWQYPHSTESWERDLSETVSKSDPETSPMSSASSVAYQEAEVSLSASGRPKRKAAAKYGTNKKQRRKGPSASSKTQSVAWMRELEAAQGPRAYAQAASSAVPYANVGLPSLRSLHLFKSLYARHHLIRKSWMMEDTRPQHITFRAHGRHVVTCLQFDTDKILTGSDDTNINVYDTKTGALRARLEGHEGGVWALQYEGNTLVSGSTDRSVRVWDIEKAKCTQIFQGHTSTVRCLVILKPTKIGENSDGTPIMMPKEPLIITGSRDSSLRVWKLPGPNDRTIYQTGPPVNDYDNPYFIRALTGHHHSVRAIAAHADTLVSGSYDSTVRVWKISTGEVLHRLQGHTAKVYSVVLDHARNRCISGSMDNLVKVWSLETGACLFNLEGHTSLVGLLDLSHDRLVSAAADSTLRIWDPENGQCKATLSAHTGAITCFQHDGQKVISGSDRTLKMWNIKTGECIKDLLTDLSGVWQVKFNERRCVAAVQRNNMTYIEVLDFGASRDGVPADQRGRRIVVDSRGREIEEISADDREALDVEAV